MLNTLNSCDYILCLVTDASLCGNRSLESVVDLALQGGVNLIQVRDKHKNTKEMIAICKSLKSIAVSYGVPLIVNDRIDVACAVDADGLHIGQYDIPYEVARRMLGKDKIIGLSINNMTQAKIAEYWDVAYLSVSPVFHTTTKKDICRPWGISRLKELCALQSKHKFIGIGGINETNIGSIFETGLTGAAMVSAICAAENPKEATENLARIIKQTLKP